MCRSATPGRLAAFDEELYRSGDMSDVVAVVAALAFSAAEGQVTAVSDSGGREGEGQEEEAGRRRRGWRRRRRRRGWRI